MKIEVELLAGIECLGIEVGGAKNERARSVGKAARAAVEFGLKDGGVWALRPETAGCR